MASLSRGGKKNERQVLTFFLPRTATGKLTLQRKYLPRLEFELRCSFHELYQFIEHGNHRFDVSGVVQVLHEHVLECREYVKVVDIKGLQYL